MEITFTITGADKLSRKLDRIASKMEGEIRSALDEVGDFLKDKLDINFDAEGTIVGAKWADGPSYHKLQRTGRLRRGWKKMLSVSDVLVYNSVEYAVYHQYGTRKMPQRKLVGIMNPLRTGIIKIVQKAISDILKSR